MRRKTLALLGALLVTLAACGGGDETAPSSEPTPSIEAPSELIGVIVSIDSSGIDDVNSFVLRSDGTEYDILIADDVDYGFPLGHLNEHRAGALPVRVALEERDGDLYALSIEDV